MHPAILVFNAGSSTVKFAAYALDEGAAAHEPLVRASVSASEEPLASVWPLVEPAMAGRNIVAIGHRIVHGGKEFAAPAIITPEVERRLEALIPLAPLHQPQGLALIGPLRRRFPEALQVACFDTAFHRTMPRVARMFALPQDLFESGIRVYGFHGISYEYIAGRLPELLDGRPHGRVVVAHLGHGSSLCALKELQSVATTMTFTPLDGLPMATRCGSIDPGVVLYLSQERGMPIAQVAELLNRRAGLLGVSGISGDVRDLLASRDPRAQLALDLLLDRIGRGIGALAAVLGGLDALVFTGGVGENALSLRERIGRNLAWLGVDLDPARNAAGEACLTSRTSRVSVWCIPTDEESVIARHTMAVLAGPRSIAVPTDSNGDPGHL